MQKLPWQLNGWVTISVRKISGHYDKLFYNSSVKGNNLLSEKYPYYPGVVEFRWEIWSATLFSIDLIDRRTFLYEC